jgi:hypothetical protein
MTTLTDVTFGLSSQALAIGHYLAGYDLDIDDGIMIKTFPFYNGREKCVGISLWRIRGGEVLVVVFGENRNSDNIVVYSWVENKPMMNPPTIDNMPDQAWEDKAMFDCGDISGASDHIIQVIKMWAVNEVGE